MADSTDDLAIGTLIANKYEITREIGRGGMGRVYLAKQQPLETVVCVKTLHSGATADPAFAARFMREAKTTSKLRHPNIVSVLDYGTALDGSAYLVMEYVEGTTLSDAVGRGGVMSASRAVRIIGQVCDALTLAHSHGIVHRDLKLPNVMLVQLPGNPDLVKVLDFGSALMLEGGEEAERLTRAGSILGTPAYMAPEYIMGRGADARIDIYATATMIYRLLCGSTPFRGKAQAVFAQQLSARPEPPRKRNPNADVSEAMESVILRGLSKDPAKRYGKAEEFKKALEAALAGQRDESYQADVGGNAAVELAREERAVVLACVNASPKTARSTLERIRSTAESLGGRPHPIKEDEQVQLFVFGLGRDIPEAADEAAQFGLRLVQSDPNLSVGIRDGQASCKGELGSPGFAYELFGDGLSIARNLAAHAAMNTVYVSGPFARHVPENLQLTPVLPPENVNEPVFALTDPMVQRDGEGGLTFTGRRREQRALLEVAVGARDSRVVIVEGRAGIGKSRLVSHMAPQAARLNVLWSVVPATADGQLGPSHPVSRVAATGWTTSSYSSSTTERYAVDVMLGRGGRMDGLVGERRQLRLISAAIDGLSRRLEQGPVVVVFDQLHYADELTWALARRILDMSSELKVSMVFCVRDASRIPIPLPHRKEVIQLEPLAPSEAQTLLVGTSVPQAAAYAPIAQGLPLALEQLVLSVQAGRQALIERLQNQPPEAVVHYLTVDRLRSISSYGQLLTQAAAILGMEPLETEVLSVAAEAKGSPSAMAEARQAGLLWRTPGGRLVFPSELVRDAVITAIPEERKTELHTRAAKLLEASGDGPRAESLGEHLLGAGEHRKAFDAYRGASAWAREQGASLRSVQCLEMALAAARGLEGLDAERAQVARELGGGLIRANQFQRALEVLSEGSLAARKAGSALLAADLLRLHGKALWKTQDRDGLREIQAASEFAQQQGIQTVGAEACADLADAYEEVGNDEKAAELLRRGLEMIETSSDAETAGVRTHLFNRLGRMELKAGSLDGAIALFTQALSLAESSHDRYERAGVLGNLGAAYARRGDMARALEFTERALHGSEALGDQVGVARQSYNLALLRVTAGQRQMAMKLLRTSFEASRRAAWYEGLARSRSALRKLGA